MPISRPLALLLAIGGAMLGAVAVAILFLAWGMASGAGILVGTGDRLEAPLSRGGDVARPNAALTDAAGTPPGPLVIDVAGAVKQPGLYRMRAGDRVGDAIAAAGGYAARADLSEASRSLNLALPLTDGSKVLVPELGFAEPGPAAASDGRIDLNRAGRSELESLPGIGPVTAGKIIAARSTERFGAVRELRSRGIVGESVFGKIRELVSVGR